MDPKKDQTDAITIFVALTALAVCAAILLIWILPLVFEILNTHFSPGLGMKDAAIIALALSLVFVIAMAIFSGDGLIGEIQFVIPGFLLLYFILWIQLAWLF